jgi:hypothetical protein
MLSSYAFLFRGSDFAVIRPHSFKGVKTGIRLAGRRRKPVPRKNGALVLAAVLTACLVVALSGCGASYTVASAAISSFQASTDAVEFGSVTVGQTATSSVTLVNQGATDIQVTSVAITGNDFNVANATTQPFSVAANGGTYSLAVQFEPKASGDSTGQLLVTSNSSKSKSLNIKLHGKGSSAVNVSAPSLSSLSCTQSSMTGAGSDACTVVLSAAAGTGGLAVSLSSNDGAATVPGSVTVPAGATSAGFTVTVSAVTTTQTATLTASAGGASQSFAINLASSQSGTGAGQPGLALNSTSVSFGSVNLNTPATQSVTLTSSGTSPLIISAGSVTGTGFSVSGLSYPKTLNPGQTATLNIQFDPTTAGAASGKVTLTSNASGGSTATISLSGTGTTVSYEVSLNWSAPTNSTDPVAGYNIYRATGSTSSYQLLNTSVTVPTTYIDTSVQSGSSYSYYVESVDAQGNQSVPSNTFNVSVP